MVRQNVGVDRQQSVLAGEAEREDVEMTQKSWVDCEAAGGRVHTGQILRVVDLLQSQLSPVVPVSVVQVLADQRVRLNSEIWIHLAAQHNHRLYYRDIKI